MFFFQYEAPIKSMMISTPVLSVILATCEDGIERREECGHGPTGQRDILRTSSEKSCVL